MRRKLAAAVMAAALSLALASCSGDDGEGATPAATGDSPGMATATGTGTRTATPVNETVAALLKLSVPQELADGLALGKPGAKVTVAVFEDFQCPHCLRFTALVEPVIVDEYVKTGKVRLEFHNLPILGQESVQAAVAGWCAGAQNKFWAYHEKLFMVQAEAGQATSEKLEVGRFSQQSLQGYAGEVGLDRAAFDACYTSEVAVEQVRADVRQAQSLGLRGTPSFVLNGQPLAASPATVAAWRKVLDEALAR